MCKKLMFLFLLPGFITFGQAQPPDNRKITEIRIDPNYARIGAASLFFKEVKFIPLQTTAASFVGSIERMAVANGHFVILDRESDAILIFKNDGAFVAKIASLPGVEKSKKAYASELFHNFCIDRDANTIVVSTRYARGKLFLFDFKGQFLNKYYYVPNKTADFITVEGNRIATRPLRPVRYTTRDGKEEVGYDGFDPYSLFVTGSDSAVFQKLLPIDMKKAPKENESLGYYTNFNYSGVPGKVFFRRFFDYHIYEVSARGIDKEYSLIFPMYKSLPPNYFSDSAGNRQRIFKIQGMIFSIDGVFCAKNIFSFSFNIMGPVFDSKSDLLYNEKTGHTVYVGGVAPDSLTQFLPPFDLRSDILACDGLNFYGSVPSYLLHRAKDRMKKPSFNKVMAEYFKNSTPQSNPVIVQWVPKDDF
jgi:6-bladed beta-propeller protein